MRYAWVFIAVLVLHVAPASAQEADAASEELIALPRRTMPLEKALIKLRQAGAEIAYRPDQLPQLMVKVPGGKRKVGAWLSFLLQRTEITFEKTDVGFLLYPDPELPLKRINLYGIITDASSGERLIGAAVQVPDEGIGVAANEYGFYSLPLSGGRKSVLVSYTGYRTFEQELVLRADSTLDFQLQPDRSLPAIIVKATDQRQGHSIHTDTRTSIGREGAQRTGGPGGEADPLRLARLLPGVESGADGLGGLFIRGNEGGHNLVLLDGVPLYNLNHAAGLLSIFSSQAIRRLDLYTEGVPSRFGGRIGGVLDVHTRDGNMYHPEVTVGSSMLAGHVTAEGPIKAGSSSFLITGRYFWAGPLLSELSRRYKENLGRRGQLNYQVYDVNLKVNQPVGKQGRLYLSAYRGVDRYENRTSDTDTLTVLNPVGALFRYATPQRRYEDVSWSNNVGALRYNHIFNQQFFGNFRLSYSDLLVDAAFERSDSLNELTTLLKSGDVFSGRYATDIRQIGLAFDGQYTTSGELTLRFGLEGSSHEFTPRLLSGSVPLSIHPSIGEGERSATERPVELSAYASLTGRIGQLYYRLGLRSQSWWNNGNFIGISPRLLLAGRLGQWSRWRLTYDRFTQNVHLVSSTVIGLPTDTWVPSTDRIAPSTSSQVGATLVSVLGKGWNSEIGIYYRNLRNLVAFSENTGRTRWEDNLTQGDGFSRGMEVTLSRSLPQFRGWLSYILAQSRRQFADPINLGRPFDFRYGRTHAVKLFALYTPSPRFSLSATWRYGSGANYSLSEETFLLVDPAQISPGDQVQTVNLVKEKNGVRLPANHRLDINAEFTFRQKSAKPRFTHTLDLGIYNVYSRHNPIYYDIQTEYFSRADQLIANRDFIQVYLAPITPTISYHLRFSKGPQK